MKYSEEILKRWCQPASDTEETKINNAINMIKDAICKSEELNGFEIEVFIQGSYANNTNVKTSSDVDVCIMLKSTFYSEYMDGLTDKDYGFTKGSITYAEYRSRVLLALQSKFGATDLVLGNKSIKISSNSYHVDADAVVTFQLKDYKSICSRNAQIFEEGIRFYSSDGLQVSNYPKIHIRNGINKNNDTNHRYKKIVRIFKHIRNNMVDEGIINEDKISSFLVECLIWNVPNNIITGYLTLDETIRQTIIFLYDKISKNGHQEWGEVSEKLYLFRGRKWTELDVENFLTQAWKYLGYEDENN